jgi:hypothetical protein
VEGLEAETVVISYMYVASSSYVPLLTEVHKCSNVGRLVGGPNRLGMRLFNSVRGIVRISLRHRAHINTTPDGINSGPMEKDFYTRLHCHP